MGGGGETGEGWTMGGGRAYGAGRVCGEWGATFLLFGGRGGERDAHQVDNLL